MRLRKVSVISGLVMLAVAVGLSASAWACTALATLEPSAAATPAGSNVAVTGSGFATKGAGPVVVHWGGVAGPEVGRATPDANGNITAQVAVPKADPGQYVLVATQAKTNGEAVYGTPARASLGVTGTDGAVPAAPVAGTDNVTTPPANSGGSGVVALTLVFAAAGLALFGAGFITLAKGGRRARPASAPVRRG